MMTSQLSYSVFILTPSSMTE